MTDLQHIFSALADPTRRSLFERLSTRGPASASELAAEMPITRQAIAKHISTLESAGLVDRREAGRAVEFVANPHRLTELESWSDRVNRSWKDRLDRLTDLS